MAHPYLVGVWGGLTASQRNRRRRTRNLPQVTDLALEQPATNGHTPAANPTEGASVGSVAGAPATPAPAGARLCQCGKPIVGRSAQAQWCTEACRREHHNRTRRPRKPQVAGTGNHPTPTVPAPQTATGGRLTAVVADLCAAGLAVTFDVDGVTVTVRS